MHINVGTAELGKSALPESVTTRATLLAAARVLRADPAATYQTIGRPSLALLPGAEDPMFDPYGTSDRRSRRTASCTALAELIALRQ
jgi:hypothetical protein